MSQDTFALYQMKLRYGTQDYRFFSLERLKALGRAIEFKNYKHVYTGTLKKDGSSVLNILKVLFERFKNTRPADYSGRSMSISDIVVLRRDEKLSAHYVDVTGFQEVREFLNGPYKYYSTQRPIDIGAFPKFGNEPIGIENFSKRQFVEDWTCRAWGALTYGTPLTQKQIDDYELLAAPGNPDHMGLAQGQLKAQIGTIGMWEQRNQIANARRLTQWYGNSGIFAKKEGVALEQIGRRYREITEKVIISQEKANKPIAEMLRAGEEEAIKYNAVHPPSIKDKSKNRC